MRTIGGASWWLSIVGVWTLVALFFVSSELLYPNGPGVTTSEIVWREFILDYLWIPLTPIVAWLAMNFPVTTPHRLKNLVIHVLSSVGISIGHILVLTGALQLANIPGEFSRPATFVELLIANFHGNIIYYWAIFAVRSAVMANRRRKAESLRAAELEDSLARTVETPASEPSAEGLKLIPVKSAGRITLVETDDIDWLQADDNYVHLHVGAKSHLIREKLGRLEKQLDSTKFMRIHRSIIVNIGRIKELQPIGGGVFEVILKNGTTVRSGPAYRDKFRAFLGS